MPSCKGNPGDIFHGSARHGFERLSIAEGMDKTIQKTGDNFTEDWQLPFCNERG